MLAAGSTDLSDEEIDGINTVHLSSLALHKDAGIEYDPKTQLVLMETEEFKKAGLIEPTGVWVIMDRTHVTNTLEERDAAKGKNIFHSEYIKWLQEWIDNTDKHIMWFTPVQLKEFCEIANVEYPIPSEF